MDIKKVDGVFDAIEKQITHLEEMLELQDRKIELLESINDSREETVWYLKRVIIRSSRRKSTKTRKLVYLRLHPSSKRRDRDVFTVSSFFAIKTVSFMRQKGA